ncbi:MAG: tRNA (adenosine(37)-N6)-dimethylallyltransferase MiaA [Victivallaceae bacterium]|nr:tRNA (adenosine(37)-N6)-dimethylallyltransferase MiaA [Victivallaceae bacterium]
MSEKIKIIVITGPTATGKTALAVKLARRFGGEIISADSRQVYSHMDIGTGKDLAEYGEIACHLIDVADPARDEYNLYRFMVDAAAAIENIAGRGKLPVVCGGSALYVGALLAGYELPGKDNFKLPFELEPLAIGVYYPRAAVRERIAARLDARFAAGMIDEIRALHDQCGVSWEKLEYFGLEYRAIARFLQGKCDEPSMHAILLDRIRQFAKRQDIFFRKLEREGAVIHWLPAGEGAETLAERFLAGRPLPEPEIRMCETFYGK